MFEVKVRKAKLEDFEVINELNGVCYGFNAAAMSERMLKRFELTYDENYCLEILIYLDESQPYFQPMKPFFDLSNP